MGRDVAGFAQKNEIGCRIVGRFLGFDQQQMGEGAAGEGVALVVFVGLIYAYISAEQFYLENPSMGVVYAGYAFSNIGLWVLVR